MIPLVCVEMMEFIFSRTIKEANSSCFYPRSRKRPEMSMAVSARQGKHGCLPALARIPNGQAGWGPRALLNFLSRTKKIFFRLPYLNHTCFSGQILVSFFLLFCFVLKQG